MMILERNRSLKVNIIVNMKKMRERKKLVMKKTIIVMAIAVAMMKKMKRKKMSFDETK